MGKAEQAVKDGEVHFCPNCKQVQPIELTYYNPDEDVDPTLIVCLICGEPIDFITNI